MPIMSSPGGRFARLALGNGASTAVSFGAAAIMAHALSSGQFVLLNVLLTLTATVAVAGGGIDSAAVRLAAVGHMTQGLSRAARTGRFAVCGLVLLAVPVVISSATGAHATPWLAVLASAAMGVGVTGLFLSLVEPQANQDFIRFTTRQLYFYGALFLASFTAILTHNVDVVVTCLAVASLTGLALLPRVNSYPPGNANGFRRLAAALLLSTVLYAVFERIDVLLVSSLASPSDAAVFAAAVRYAGGLGLVTGAFVAFATPIVSRASSAVELRHAVRHLMGPLALVLLATVAAALIAPFAVPILFGSSYGPAVGLAQIYVVQYPILAIYIVFVLAFPQLGSLRWQLEVTLVILTVEVAVLAVNARNVHVAVWGSPLGHLAGLLYVCVRARTMLRR